MRPAPTPAPCDSQIVRFCLRRVIVQDNRGLAASPLVGYTLRVERGGDLLSLFFFSPPCVLPAPCLFPAPSVRTSVAAGPHRPRCPAGAAFGRVTRENAALT
ncbi:hypothetical protein GCM10023324_09630 [Streptomyces youssoufiensis]